MNYDQQKIERMRESYPKGTRVKLNSMQDERQMPAGLVGIVDCIDDAGQIRVTWDNGSTLALIPDKDNFSLISRPQQGKEIKFYYPAIASYYPTETDDYGYGETSQYPEELPSELAALHLQAVLQKIENTNSDIDKTRGLMEYYSEQDSVNGKVVSAVPSAEVIDGRLYGVAKCVIKSKLAPEEINKLKDYISGQMSDGYGESFEQQPIKTGNRDINEIYVSFWNNDGDWEIKSENEMKPCTEQGRRQSESLSPLIKNGQIL